MEKDERFNIILATIPFPLVFSRIGRNTGPSDFPTLDTVPGDCGGMSVLATFTLIH